MGSSKKHKDKDREHRRKHKHKDRSRSRSRSRSRERERKHRNRDDKEKRKKRVEASEQLDEFRIPDNDEKARKKEVDVTPVQSASASGDMELSVEATNKLRAKLGLAPLEVNIAGGDGEEKESCKDDVHRPAVNIAEVKKSADLKEKMAQMKQKRLLNIKLGKVKTLAESDSEEDDTLAWVKKSRKKEKEKVLAEKRAKMLEDMDAEFGIASLLEEEFGPKKKQTYSSKDLRGLKVQHGQDTFKEGKTVILTLADKGVLDEDGDELMNMNMVDADKTKKNIENKKKRPDYKPYDEPDYDEYGMLKPKNVLDKYDEEIEGEQMETFTLGAGGRYNAEHERNMNDIRSQLQNQRQTLDSAEPQLMSEFYTATEMEKFKKVKKKTRKIRKKASVLKADDLLPLADKDPSIDLGSRVKTDPDAENGEWSAAFSSDILKPEKGWTTSQEDMQMDTSNVVEEDWSSLPIEEDDAQQELQRALEKTRKLKMKKEFLDPATIAARVMSKDTGGQEASKQDGSSIMLNSTSEFCRSLGDIPTYGLAGNREEDRDELLDIEMELMEERRKKAEEDQQATGWEQVDIDDRPVNIKDEENAILDDEIVLNTGVGAALALANTKGYLVEGEKIHGAAIITKNRDMLAQRFSIEDKNYNDLDEKFKKRDRFSGGIMQDFKEKDTYKPNVELTYIDDAGRKLNQKEAFRQLSHRFHGKGSGKKKTEKRTKKIEEDNLMLQMSSTDTPLNTVALLQQKQAKEKTPYIVLSGGGKTLTSTPVVK